MNSLVRGLLRPSLSLEKVQCLSNPVIPAFYHVSAPVLAGQEWRRGRNMPLNPNKYGPFADLPDYTYLDGRPTPLGRSRLKRAMKQRELATKIIQFSEEMDFAVDLHKRKQAEEEAKKKAILDRKLKPKGKRIAAPTSD